MSRKRSTGLGGVTNLSVLAPIKQGMVIGFEPISYLERLRKVLDALQAARQNVRESELHPPFFADAVGRFGIIQHFRYAIVPPDPGAASQPLDGTWRLSLNVTFDGGWEPYMRVIYRDLGTLLDLLFCHSPGYPYSSASFEAYCDWVRRNEVEGGLFYADSATTLGDQRYTGVIEKHQREREPGAATDDALARFAVPADKLRDDRAMAAALRDPRVSLALPLRTLKGLYRLSTYFPHGTAPPGQPDEGEILHRFALRILGQPIEVIEKIGAAGAALKALFKDELGWLKPSLVGAPSPPAPPPPPAPVPFDPKDLQAHLLAQEQMTHGAVVLLRVTDAGQARTRLAALAAECGPVAPGGIGSLVAFTHAGLQALRLAQPTLDALPQEFVDGMEARCALLGDVRGNHPDHWARPEAYAAALKGQRVDLKVVHVLVQWRLADADANAPHTLHPRLAPKVAALQAADTGLRVLAVQPTRSYREGSNTTGHFDFADGISQPRPVPRAAGTKPANRDDVRPGELVIGHANDRDDPANPSIDPFLKDGSFLVVRKLRQRVDHLEAALARIEARQPHGAPGLREELLSKMMGRRGDGTPLVPVPVPAGAPPAPSNDFDFTTPPASDACPFHSHIRRANPRDGRAYTPRILRRGMSYGPRSRFDLASERGVVFMAYCASIAEQFETVQRWIAGGNSSGVSSAQGDPFLRVPQAGEPSTFRYLDSKGNVARADLGDRPFVQLDWGLYLFVPSLTALAKLGDASSRAAAAAGADDAPPPATGPEPDLEAMRQRLDDPDRAKIEWQRVRQSGSKGPVQTAYGTLIGTHPEVLQVLKDKTGHSVCGYADRMRLSVGVNLLGVDVGTERDNAYALIDGILSIKAKDAFAVAAQVVDKVLLNFPELPTPAGEAPSRRYPIDLVSFSDHVLAALCSYWVGLPDAAAPGTLPHMIPGGRQETGSNPPRCPGHFSTASRYIFSPHPRVDVEQAGREQGTEALEAVRAWLAGNPVLPAFAAKIKQGLDAKGGTTDDLALGLSGVLLGFPPTVQGNFIRTVETWIKGEDLWKHQQTLFEKIADNPGADAYEPAHQAMHDELLTTMRQRPVPEMLWRSPMVKGQVDPDPAHRVVLGITSALTDPAAPNALIFGHDAPENPKTIHGCPGYAMAMGVMLAMFAGLMKAGTLRPTGSPVLLILTRPPA